MIENSHKPDDLYPYVPTNDSENSQKFKINCFLETHDYYLAKIYE